MKKRKKTLTLKTIESSIIFLFILFVLLCFYPYQFYSVYFFFIPDGTNYVSGYFILVLLAAITPLFLYKRRLKCSSPVLLVMGVQLFGFSIVGIAHGRFDIGPFLARMFLAFLLLMFLSNTTGLKDFIIKYNKWILLMSIMGVIGWALVTFWGMMPFYIVIDRADEDRYIANYLLTFRALDNSNADNMRYAGFFDEPGAMGQWGIFALLFNKIFIKNKRVEFLLIFCLLLTFSMGLYLQFFFYMLFFYGNFKNGTNTIVCLLLVIIVAIGIKMTENTEYDFFYQKTVGRIENIFDESRSSGKVNIAVDNRAKHTEIAYKAFTENPLFGSDKKDLDLGGNFYETLGLYGIVGSFFILSPYLLLLFWSIKYKDKDLFMCFIILVVGFSNRPFHNNLLTYFILYTFIALYYQTRKDYRLKY